MLNRSCRWFYNCFRNFHTISILNNNPIHSKALCTSYNRSKVSWILNLIQHNYSWLFFSQKLFQKRRKIHIIIKFWNKYHNPLWIFSPSISIKNLYILSTCQIQYFLDCFLLYLLINLQLLNIFIRFQHFNHWIYTYYLLHYFFSLFLLIILK